MAGPEVGIKFTADSKEVTAEVARVTQEVTLMGKSLNSSNDIAVQSWKKSAAAGKEYLNTVGATTLQHAKFDAAVRTTEEHLSRVSNVTVASTHNLGFWGALQAEAAGHTGEHSLAIGRLERSLASFGERSLGVNSTVGLLTTSLGKFAMGSIEITAILIGVDAIIAIYDKLTEGARKAKEEQNKLVDALATWALPSIGPRSIIAKEYEGTLKQQADDVRHLKILMDAKTDFAVAAAYAAAGEAAPFRSRQDEIDALTKDLAKVNVALADARVKGAAEGKLKDVRIEPDKPLKGLEGAELAQLHDAIRIGTAAIANLDAALKRNELAVNQLAATHLATLEKQAGGMDIARPAGALSELAVIEAKREIARKEIEDRRLTSDLAAAQQAAADEDEFAAVQALNRRIEAENDRHNKEVLKQDTEAATKKQRAIQSRAQIILAVETGMTNALISGTKDLGRQLLRAALEPEVKLMQGLAAKQFALAAGDFAALNFAGGARHLEAGAVFFTEAAVIAALAGSGGGGGSKGGGGGGGSGSAGAGMGAQFGASGGTQGGPIKLEIVVVHQDQTGREIARTNQIIQRFNDRNQPVRVTL